MHCCVSDARVGHWSFVHLVHSGVPAAAANAAAAVATARLLCRSWDVSPCRPVSRSPELLSYVSTHVPRSQPRWVGTCAHAGSGSGTGAGQQKSSTAAASFSATVKVKLHGCLPTTGSRHEVMPNPSSAPFGSGPANFGRCGGGARVSSRQHLFLLSALRLSPEHATSSLPLSAGSCLHRRQPFPLTTP